MSPGARWGGWRTSPESAAPVRITKGTREPEPMTSRQAQYLRALCAQHGEKFNPTWTKAQATKRINQLKNRP